MAKGRVWHSEDARGPGFLAAFCFVCLAQPFQHLDQFLGERRVPAPCKISSLGRS